MERIWIYQANRILTQDERARIQTKLASFTSQWKAHAQKLTAYAQVKYNLFIILAVDESVALPSGCSIDKSVHLLKSLEGELGITLFDRMQIAYRSIEGIRVVPRKQFEQLIDEGAIHQNTIVFNNLASSKEEFDTNWEIPFKNSWHAKVFPMPVN